MRIFEHRHRFDRHQRALTVCSLATGAPVTVMRFAACRCGLVDEHITAAGWQQIQFGADRTKWKYEDA